MKIKTKLWLFSAICIGVPSIIVVVSIMFFIAPQVREQAQSHLIAQSNIQKNRIQRAITRSFDELKLISSRTQMRISLQRYQESPSNSDLEKIQKILSDARKSVDRIKRITVYNTDGEPVTGVPEVDVAHDYSDKLVNMIRSGEETRFLGFAEEANKNSMHLGAKLTLKGELVGAIHVEFEGSLFTSIASDYTGLGRTGETILFINSGEKSRLLSPVRFNGNDIIQESLLVETPFFKMISNTDLLGMVEAIDYRNQKVLVHKSSIPELSLSIVLKKDTDEVFGLLDIIRNSIFLVLILLVVITFFVVKKFTLPIQKLTEVAQKISDGDYTAHVEIDSHDEISSLAKSIDSITLQLVSTTNSLLELNDKMKEFVGVVSHDLRTPIINIVSVVDLIEDEDDKEYINEMLPQIRNYSELSLEMVNQLLDLMAMETGKINFNFEKLSLLTLRVQMNALFHLLAKKKDINFELEFDETINVMVDEFRFTQALSNLVNNAIKFTPRGGSVKLRSEKIGEKVRIIVEDSGVGIPETMITKVFDKAEHVTRKGTENEKGTGFGLPLVQEIIKAHGSEVFLSSEEGKGSKFWLELDIAN